MFCKLLTIRSIFILLAVLSATHLLSPVLASFAESGQHITIEQGLSQSTVQAIIQDSQGFMWFGTQDGLNKYDGYKFTVYRRDPARSDTLLANAITALAEDNTVLVTVENIINGGIIRVWGVK